MLRLMLLRHAKSDWPAGIGDHERPLTGRGREASRRAGRYMEEEGLRPDLALVSTARRAQETWELARLAFVERIPHHDERRLYAAPANAILDVVREGGGGTRTLLVVGHNPGLEDLALKLIGDAGDADLARLKLKYPTAGLAVIDFDMAAWSGVAEGLGRLERFVTPKSLEGAEGE